MATPATSNNPNLKKLLVAAGLLVVIVVFAFPSGSSSSMKGTKNPVVFGDPSKKKKDSLYTEDDRTKRFEPINASLKNGFVPLVTKGSNTDNGKNVVPSSFTDGEGTWIYTGNMSVDGTPNALLENTSTSEGVFLRPGQHWKNLRLIAVREDCIDVEGPHGARKTVYFEDKSLNSTAGTGPATTLQPLPPATIQGNLPGSGANPQPGGNPRRNGFGGAQASTEAMVGPIGASNDLESSVDLQTQTNNQNNNGNNRRIRRNQ